MVAAHVENDRGKNTTAIRLRNELFDELTERLGATNDTARAQLVGVDRKTLWRIKQAKFTASLEVAVRMADRLGTTVDELFEQVAA
jgi:DNA-binding XRE family transcriptional regulator